MVSTSVERWIVVFSQQTGAVRQVWPVRLAGPNATLPEPSRFVHFVDAASQEEAVKLAEVELAIQNEYL